MNKLFFIVSVAIISCCTAKKTANRESNNPDSSSVNSNKGNSSEPGTNLPACIQKLVVQFQQEEKQNPPRSIYSYVYNGKPVFFVPAVCCDFFSDLYDDTCKLIAHPDGGFTGRGDGTAPDFMQIRTNEKLLWKDERK